VDSLGKVAVLPEAAWRSNQKEADERIEMARRALEAAFQDFPCGSLGEPGGIRGFSQWADQTEGAVLSKLGSQGVDTVIFLRLEELTPRLAITLSLPFLWVGTSEVDFRIRAVAAATGSVEADFRVRRSTGGPFHLRPAAWSGREFETALRSAIVGARDR
jgi:hypothetical protein